MNATVATKRQRWTPAEEKSLLATAKGRSGQDLADLFESVAAERGVSPSTVRSKFYALKKPRKGARGSWSKRAGNQLVREASSVSGRERTKVFEEWAERRGISVNAVKQKYYQLGGAATGAEKPAAAAPATNGNGSAPRATRVAASNGAPSAASVPDADLAGMTMLELAQLGRRVSDELERRIASVASLWA